MVGMTNPSSTSPDNLNPVRQIIKDWTARIHPDPKTQTAVAHALIKTLSDDFKAEGFENHSTDAGLLILSHPQMMEDGYGDPPRLRVSSRSDGWVWHWERGGTVEKIKGLSFDPADARFSGPEGAEADEFLAEFIMKKFSQKLRPSDDMKVYVARPQRR